MLNQLYSSGAISNSVLRKLEGLFQLRNGIAHGFSVPVVIDANVVLFVVETARRLLDDSRPARQTA
jgi:hypothetical protein